MKRYVGVAVLVLLAASAGWALGRGDSPSGEGARADTVRVAPADYARIREELATSIAEVGSLRGRLEGVTERMPETVYVTDTLVVADTVLVVIDSRGRLTYQFATAFDRPAPAELRTNIDVSDCDDGVMVRNREVICNPPVLGHLSLYLRVSGGTAPAAFAPAYGMSAGLEWSPTFRSNTRIFAEARTDGRIYAGISLGRRLW